MDRKIKIEQHGGLGVLWMIGWLFSIGFLKLGFFKGLIAILLWPYFVGAHFADASVPVIAPQQIEQVAE